MPAFVRRRIGHTRAMAWPESIAWHELVALMVVGDGRDHTLRGIASSRDTVDHRQRVWQRGELQRFETIGGRVTMINGADTHWVWLDGAAIPTAFPRATTAWGPAHNALLGRGDYDHWQGTDFTRPTGEAVAQEFLGRPAWRIELAPPRGKPYPLTRIVDAQTGLVLSQANAGFETVDEWVELRFDEELAEELFEWTGEVQQPLDRFEEHERMMAARQAWLDDRSVTDLPLAAPAQLRLNEFGTDGAFHASIDASLQGSLLRRPHSNSSWEEFLAWDHIETWSDERWDWMLGTDAPLAPEDLAALKARLAMTT
jgi:hypothetical protein